MTLFFFVFPSQCSGFSALSLEERVHGHPGTQSSFLSEVLSSCLSPEQLGPANSRSPGIASWIA